jgi:hypothetical protein
MQASEFKLNFHLKIPFWLREPRNSLEYTKIDSSRYSSRGLSTAVGADPSFCHFLFPARRRRRRARPSAAPSSFAPHGHAAKPLLTRAHVWRKRAIFEYQSAADDGAIL